MLKKKKSNSSIKALNQKNEELINVNLFSITKGKYHWMNFISNNYYPSFINEEILGDELEIFLDFYEKNYPKHPFFAILFKLRLPNGHIRSCSSTQCANTSGFEELMSKFSYIFILENFLESVSEDEKINANVPAGNVIFTFKPLLKIENTKYENCFILKNNKNVALRENKNFENNFKYKEFTIPLTMDLHKWPNIQFSPDKKTAYASFNFVNDYQLDFLITINNNGYFIVVKNKDLVLFTITDTINYIPYSIDFKRVIIDGDKEKIYYIHNNKVVLYTEDLKDTKFIEPIMKQPLNKPKILTLDFETRDINNVKVPLSMCIYDGKKTFYYLFQNPDNWVNDMIKGFRNSIMCRKYNYYKIYIHNLSYFDSVFLIDGLSRMGSLKPFKRDNSTLKLVFKYRVHKKGPEYTLTFYDSLLIFQDSLRNLSKSFNIENKKDYFPYGFLNNVDLDLNYKGNVPNIKYFLNSFGDDELEAKKEYEAYSLKYSNNFWNLRRELFLYCRKDCVALYEIIIKFHKIIHDLFKIDITKFATLPSLTYAIYKANYMEKDKIPKILSKRHYTIKKSYYGGITEAYKPQGFNIQSYDVNSLYPSVMYKWGMPIGIPKYFLGNISLLNDETFGFFKVKVTTPLGIDKPTLPKKIKTSDGLRTTFPVGTWTDWYFSEELKDKLKDGYRFKILEGYLFKKGIIFNEYIKVLYKIKSTTNSNDSLYYISKLLMNSLYGRFGLNPEEVEVSIVSHEESEKLLFEKENVITIPLLSGKVMVSYDKTNSDEINITDISVPIASAIAAYSRIEMSKYIRKYNENIYYIDTDGIKVDCDLDQAEIDSKELGMMKYEYSLHEGVFPSPKVYGGILTKPYKNYKYEIVKIRGLKNPISFNNLKRMNNKHNVIKLKQEKWYRFLTKSAIIVEETSYKLSLIENKREMVFDSMGNIINTIPFYLNNGILEKRNPQVLHYLPLQKIIKCLPTPKIIKYLPVPEIIKCLPKPKVIKCLPKPKIIKYLPTPQNNTLIYLNHKKHQSLLSFISVNKESYQRSWMKKCNIALIKYFYTYLNKKYKKLRNNSAYMKWIYILWLFIEPVIAILPWGFIDLDWWLNNIENLNNVSNEQTNSININSSHEVAHEPSLIIELTILGLIYFLVITFNAYIREAEKNEILTEIIREQSFTIGTLEYVRDVLFNL
jgi:hypothetical protein